MCVSHSLETCLKQFWFFFRLKYAEQTIVSMYEELQVIRATQETEEDLKRTANELCNAVADIDHQVRNFATSLSMRGKTVKIDRGPIL